MKNLPLINDVSCLNPIPVAKILRPKTIPELAHIVRSHCGAISIGGGRFSMGGQIACEQSLHIDMQGLNQIIDFQPAEKIIHVQAGIRWSDIQHVIDPHNLSIKIMQTYANFTVGGSMSVNAHGRYMGQGSLIFSIRKFTLMRADGGLIEASPTHNAEIFYGAIGGYGGLGIIAEVVLELTDNCKIEQQQCKLKVSDYKNYFLEHVRNNSSALLHNADIYPPHYTKTRAITWLKTEKPLTITERITKNKRTYCKERYLLWAISSTPFGKWRREYLIDPIIYLYKRVSWRNYEAGSYDVAELEPRSRDKYTYILQEYFVPIAKFDIFMQNLRAILQRYKVNVLNISIRHAKKDPGSLLAWGKEEVFAFVLYYKQGTCALAKNKVAIWTRELINAALEVGGSYYLPYQIQATVEQFHQAYPGARAFFALKQRLDPENKFRNKLWDKYYPVQSEVHTMPDINSEFKKVFADTEWRDKFFLFLQNIYNIYPENKFHYLIQETIAVNNSDAEIYAAIQQKLVHIKPFLSELRFALPALIKQKKEMARQTLELLGEQQVIDGYVEIGSTGRYISELIKHLQINGSIYLINELPPTYSPTDVIERGSIRKLGNYLALNNYNPIDEALIADNSIDLVTCYIGLHHAPLDSLDNFVLSIRRILRPGGKFIIRDHNVSSKEMHSFVSLIHTVFNAGLGVPWQENLKELRHFSSLEMLINYLQDRGFSCGDKRLLQKNDPSENTLLEFIKNS